MGIHGLSKLIGDNAPHAMKEGKIENYLGYKVAIDASMAIYQFLIAVRQAGGEGQLTNENGEVTSHLIGMLHRTINMMEAGLKPVFVFDGKPPTMKSGQLAKRKERQQAAEAELTKLQESGGSAEEIERQQKRIVRATREQSEEVKKLLILMGVPVVDAPCEAEATCAALNKAGLVYATGTEDMDALTFGTPIMLRHLNSPQSRKLPIVEIKLDRTLHDFGISMEQFIDVCILCGCDYVESIKGIGHITALKLIREHDNLEGVLAHLEKKKTPLPEPFPFDEARRLFQEPEVVDTSTIELKWIEPDVPGLLKYLVEEKQFAEERVQSAIKRLQACKGKNSQNRLESFFGPATIVPSAAKEAKRKAAEQAAKTKGIKGKMAANKKAKR
eukprot:CAMPEP_0119312008 /NCGR_PEP_ID=MMETSP1333-20130426/24713_1 /TAXON_ID=418940 /ORGANISM="Scyphosphaera apsteinii, Strain RCC1455" /LENGTH=386 /DNA_ID=CAMNT_0007316543 /DNA_START=33 /DNA_END=1193 /DNA_ORIENTATION=-